MGDFLTELHCAEVEGASYTFRIDAQGEACIKNCRARCKCLRIPDSLNGFPVTSIGESAFAKLSNVEDVVCPCELRHIGRHAFEGCLRLRSIVLNSGLRSIDEEAFFLCTALGELAVPASVERLGARPLGSSALPRLRKDSPFAVRFSPDNDRLFFDADDVLYERREDGLVLVDAYRFEGSTLTCNPQTVEIGPRACSSMSALVRIVLPEGLRRIGDAAFRGSTKLAHITLPESLEEIGAAAFSSTALESLNIPERCTRIEDSAFALGSIADDGSVRPYASKLSSICVDDNNATFTMRGNVLCRRLEDGKLEACLATAAPEHVCISSDIEIVRDTAFAGTRSIGILQIEDGMLLESVNSLLGPCTIETLQVRLEDGAALELALPAERSREIMSRGTASGRFNAHALACAYDEALEGIRDGFEQARLGLRRLAHPVFLNEPLRKRLRAHIGSLLPALCSALAQRGMFSYFELMADADLLDNDRISELVAALSAQGDAEAVGYLLDMRQTRFEKASWDDYEL